MPTYESIAAALKSGGLDAVDELYYPGDRAGAKLRRRSYPRPEGTGREVGKLECTQVFRRSDSWVGDRACHDFYMDGVWIGSIIEVRRGFCDIHYRTHDGQTFAHSGGPTGAEKYLKERYWLYGDPPKTVFSKLRSLFGASS